MKIKGRLTILVSGESTTIQISDDNASVRIIEIKITPEELSLLLSRRADLPVEMNVYNLEKVGKTHEHARYLFEIPDELNSSTKSLELTELCIESLAKDGMTDWTPDSYFGSQDSFRGSNGKYFANAVIRRWI